MNSDEQLAPIFANYILKHCKKLNKQGYKGDDIALDGHSHLRYNPLNQFNIKCLCILYKNTPLRDLVINYLQLKYKINSSYSYEKNVVGACQHHLSVEWTIL
jgi:hypothetical protein